jgi:putative FmdB family regulatory protein
MPTYEYQCLKCGHRFEKLQSIKDNPVEKCPLCSQRVARLIGAGAGLIFKGAGFYATEYRSSSYRQGIQAEKGDGTTKPVAAASPDPEKNSKGEPK